MAHRSRALAVALAVVTGACGSSGAGERDANVAPPDAEPDATADGGDPYCDTLVRCEARTAETWVPPPAPVLERVSKDGGWEVLVSPPARGHGDVTVTFGGLLEGVHPIATGECPDCAARSVITVIEATGRRHDLAVGFPVDDLGWVTPGENVTIEATARSSAWPQNSTDTTVIAKLGGADGEPWWQVTNESVVDEPLRGSAIYEIAVAVDPEPICHFDVVTTYCTFLFVEDALLVTAPGAPTTRLLTGETVELLAPLGSPDGTRARVRVTHWRAHHHDWSLAGRCTDTGCGPLIPAIASYQAVRVGEE